MPDRLGLQQACRADRGGCAVDPVQMVVEWSCTCPQLDQRYGEPARDLTGEFEEALRWQSVIQF